MNLKQFNGGQIGMGWFFSVSILAGLLCAVAIYMNPSIETGWDRARVEAAHREGLYEEEHFDTVSSVRVAHAYAKNIMVGWKHWWRSYVSPRLTRARPKEHPA